MRHAGLDDSRAGIMTARGNINNLRYEDDTTLMAESTKRNWRASWWGWRGGTKLKINKTEIMASHPIPSWKIEGKKVEAVTDFIFLGFRITENVYCSHEIKRCLLLGRKAKTNLGSLLRNKDIRLPAKVHIVKAMAFPVAMYRCESWTIKKAECWRTDAFIFWCWRRFESPWYSKEIKPVNPKGDEFWIFIGMTDAETEAPVFHQPDTKSWLTEINPDAGENWKQSFLSCQRRRWQRMRWWVGITNSADINLTKLQETEDSWCAAFHGVPKSWTWLHNRTATQQRFTTQTEKYGSRFSRICFYLPWCWFFEHCKG